MLIESTISSPNKIKYVYILFSIFFTKKNPKRRHLEQNARKTNNFRQNSKILKNMFLHRWEDFS